MTDVKVMSVTFLWHVLGIDLVMDRTFHMTISHTPLGTQRHVEMIETICRFTQKEKDT
jgi:uncharacterized membrane protein YecN with MAPEG domain